MYIYEIINMSSFIVPRRCWFWCSSIVSRLMWRTCVTFSCLKKGTHLFIRKYIFLYDSNKRRIFLTLARLIFVKYLCIFICIFLALVLKNKELQILFTITYCHPFSTLINSIFSCKTYANVPSGVIEVLCNK